VGVVQAGVDDLVHPGDHDFFKKAGCLLGLLLKALYYPLVVVGEVALVTTTRQVA
jgi:hypothetical protein